MTYQLVLALPGLLLAVHVAAHGIMSVMKERAQPAAAHYVLMATAGALLTPLVRMMLHGW